ncbi:hypothetical protein KFE25_005023 [Diacronema lutheri]|uniref:Uncharacterized protein n=1 Tax=Diacronema lutheri TaxID=2081491 RepID=A0A8J5XGJ7_DIALT|nr:hypothetical protein KFE25_005023 [Diacronema lutheri]
MPGAFRAHQPRACRVLYVRILHVLLIWLLQGAVAWQPGSRTRFDSASKETTAQIATSSKETSAQMAQTTAQIAQLDVKFAQLDVKFTVLLCMFAALVLVGIALVKGSDAEQR